MIERGWRILKVKVGRPEAMDDAAVVLALRKAVGDEIEIRADANQAYDVKTAIRVIRRMEEANLASSSSRCTATTSTGWRRCARAVERADHGRRGRRDARGHHRARAAPRRRLGQHLRRSGPAASTAPSGWPRSPRRAACAPTSAGRSRASSAPRAGLHFAASSPAVDLGCEMTGQFLLKDDFGAAPLAVEDGAFVVPRGPGSGSSSTRRSSRRTATATSSDSSSRGGLLRVRLRARSLASTSTGTSSSSSSPRSSDSTTPGSPTRRSSATRTSILAALALVDVERSRSAWA